MIRIKRVYDPPADDDGRRILVERLWPRGIKKADLKLDDWFKEAAPSTELRKWFNHDPGKWKKFQTKYHKELGHHQEAWEPILTAAKDGRVTLLFSSRDSEHNNVLALKDYLDKKLKK